MDVILKVLEGAKSGATIAVKKNEFLIGRGQTCHLCAGSSAISRQHCAILRDENTVSVKDLGSRNGTLVNGVKITEPVQLKSGDELTVGPLKFLVAITPGIANAKRPEVKDVADAVARTAEKSSGPPADDDITKWLLAPDPSALSETQTIRMDDTHAGDLKKMLTAETRALEPEETPSASTSGEGDEEHSEEPEDSAGESDKGKRKPGKLPTIPQKPGAKDSREAAAEALRAWSRRR